MQPSHQGWVGFGNLKCPGGWWLVQVPQSGWVGAQFAGGIETRWCPASH